MTKEILSTLGESAKEKEKQNLEQPVKTARVAPKKGKEIATQSQEDKEKEKERIRKAQEDHPTRCWFDVFFCTMIKKNIMNRYSKKNEPAVFGIQLEAQRPNLQRTFIEPRNIYGENNLKGFNFHTKICFEEQGQYGIVYLRAGEFQPGQQIMDLDYLREIIVIDDSVSTYEDFGYTKEQAHKALHEIKR